MGDGEGGEVFGAGRQEFGLDIGAVSALSRMAQKSRANGCLTAQQPRTIRLFQGVFAGGETSEMVLARSRRISSASFVICYLLSAAKLGHSDVRHRTFISISSHIFSSPGVAIYSNNSFRVGIGS